MQKNIIIAISIIVLIGMGWFFVNPNNQTNQTATVVGVNGGNKAPAFQITTIDNKTVSSNDVRGKVVVITSSAAWCPTCVMEAQQFAPAYKKFNGRSVIFLTIDIDPRDSKEFIRQFRKDNDTPWDYADAQGGAQIIENYKLNRFEITYVLDKDGVIRFKDGVITSTEKLTEIIEQLI